MHKGIIKTQQSVYAEPVNNEQTNNSIIEKLNNLKKKLKKVN
jgi:CRISPR-associated endonuclease Cas2